MSTKHPIEHPTERARAALIEAAEVEDEELAILMLRVADALPRRAPGAAAPRPRAKPKTAKRSSNVVQLVRS